MTPPDPAPGQQVNFLNPNPAIQATRLVINKFDHPKYGYLRITVNKKQLQIDYHPVSASTSHTSVDTVVVDLSRHTSR